MENISEAGVVLRIALTPEQAAQSTGFSRTRIFEAIRGEELTARKSGKATVIEVAELARWIRSLPARGRQSDRIVAWQCVELGLWR